jgi:hypothetical protein
MEAKMKHVALAVMMLAAAGCADASNPGPVAVAAQARAGSWRVNLKEARQELLAATPPASRPPRPTW